MSSKCLLWQELRKGIKTHTCFITVSFLQHYDLMMNMCQFLFGDTVRYWPTFFSPQDGQIKVARSVDYESGDRVYRVVVRASAADNSGRYATATVTVSINDVNDNLPIFSQVHTHTNTLTYKHTHTNTYTHVKSIKDNIHNRPISSSSSFSD